MDIPIQWLHGAVEVTEWQSFNAVCLFFFWMTHDSCVEVTGLQSLLTWYCTILLNCGMEATSSACEKKKR